MTESLSVTMLYSRKFSTTYTIIKTLLTRRKNSFQENLTSLQTHVLWNQQVFLICNWCHIPRGIMKHRHLIR